MVGETIGSYRVLGKIGAGAMGEVYLAEHRHLKRKAAIKVLSRDLAGNAELLDRFFVEARATSVIEHPGIVQIFDCEVDGNGRPYIVMEYLAGDTLAATLSKRGPLPPPTAAAIGRGMAEALAAAHDKGIVHRDLKPDNIFVQQNPPDSIKLVDFGIAKLVGELQGGMQRTLSGIMMGTPLYMSPEQCRGSGTLDHRTDIYSLGCVLYETLSGRPPFQHPGLGELVVAHLTEEPRDLRALRGEVPSELAAVVADLLRKVPAERPPDMHEVARRLAPFAPEPAVRSSRPPTAAAVATAMPVAATTARPGSKTTLGQLASELVSDGAGGAGRRGGKRRLVWVAVASVAVAAGAVFYWQRGGGGGDDGAAPPATAGPASAPPAGTAPPIGSQAAGARAEDIPAARAGAAAVGSAAAPAVVAPAAMVAARAEGKPGKAGSKIGARVKTQALRAPGGAAVSDPPGAAPEAPAAATAAAGAAEAPAAGQALAGAWSGSWRDQANGQRGTLRLHVGDGGAVSGTMFYAQSNQTFRVTGKLQPDGDLGLTCACPPGRQFDVRGSLRPGAAGRLAGRLSLSTTAGVFGVTDVDLGRGGAAAAKSWAEILPGTWFQFESAPALYVFRADRTGARTTYPAGYRAPGRTFPFGWTVSGDTLVMRFSDGWEDVISLRGYDRAGSKLQRSSQRGGGNGPWFGCASGHVPAEVSNGACR